MSTVASPANSAEAIKMLRVAMGFLHANATEMVTEEQAQCLQALEQVDSMSTATRASVLHSFISGRGYCADADYSPRSWLIHRTRITKGAATAHTAWARRAAAHPLVAAALAEGHVLSESYGRKLCAWTDKLPEDCRDAADAILVAAARAGQTSRTWSSWPWRSTHGPTPTTTVQAMASRTGRSGSRPRSAARASSPAIRPPNAPRSLPRCSTPCRPRWTPRTPVRTVSATTTRSRTP